MPPTPPTCRSSWSRLPGSISFADALRAGVEIYQSLKSILRQGGHNLNVGDEGGFAPSLPSNRDAIEVVLQAIETAGYRPGEQVHIALDVAASELWNADAGRYDLEREGVSLTAGELVDLYAGWCREYPIISIEDGLDEDDWDGWVAMTRRLGGSVAVGGRRPAGDQHRAVAARASQSPPATLFCSSPTRLGR